MTDLEYPPMISIHLAMPEFIDSDDMTIGVSKKWPPRICCIDLVRAPIIIDSPHELPMLDYFVTDQYVRCMDVVQNTNVIMDALGEAGELRARFHRLHRALKNDRGVAAACRSIRAFLICDEPKADG